MRWRPRPSVRTRLHGDAIDHTSTLIIVDEPPAPEVMWRTRQRRFLLVKADHPG